MKNKRLVLYQQFVPHMKVRLVLCASGSRALLTLVTSREDGDYTKIIRVKQNGGGNYLIMY